MAHDSQYYAAYAVEETAEGVIPPAALQELSVKQFDLKANRTNQPVEAWHGTGPDRRRALPSHTVSADGGLTVGSALIHKNLLLFHEGVLGADIGAPVLANGTDIAFDSVGGTITSTVTDLSAFQEGDLVYVTGSPANNGWRGPVTAVAANSLTVAGLTTAAAGPDVTLKTQRLLDGVLQKTYTVEREALGGRFKSGSLYAVTKGMWKWEQSAFATEEYTLVGQEPLTFPASVGTGPALPRVPRNPLPANRRMGRVSVDGVLSALVMSELTLTVESPLHQKRGLSRDLEAVGDTSLKTTLAATVVSRDPALDLDMVFEGNLTTSIWFSMADRAGLEMAVSIPALKQDGEENTGQGLADIAVNGTAHDPAQDPDSPYNFPYQVGFFFA